MKIHRIYQQVFYYAGIASLFLLLITFTFRSPVASWMVHRQAEKFGVHYGAELKIDKVRILGLASIRITGISLKPKDNDTLLKIDTAYVSIGILKLLLGRLSIHDVELINFKLTPQSRDSLNNYMFLAAREVSKADTAREITPSGPVSFSTTARQLLRFIFDKIPLSLKLKNFQMIHTRDAHVVELNIPNLSLKRHFFRSTMILREDSLRQLWTVAGRLDNSAGVAEFRIFREDSGRVRIPYLERNWQAGVEMDTLAFRFAEEETETEVARLGGYVTVMGLMVDHRMIAVQPVVFEKLSVDYAIAVGEDYVELDSSTRVTFNRVDFNPYIRYRPYPTRQITLNIHKSPFPAQDLFSSFPEGLFTNLDGIRVKGNLSWHLDFEVDLANPDSLYFETSLDRHQFGILAFGNCDLAKINGSFSHTVWEHDQPVRTFTVGPENPDFRRLDQIAPWLQYAIMTSEDGAFYLHRGFLPDAFRESIITNIKERRFARGGSTISMQLVKNVFLKRNKTVARKLEEALIVWLIENQGLVTKERMMEVYLNIIEWGPMVYGAGEAARFYFNKDVSKLDLAEAIFLASIVPRPKWFRSSFDETGHLRPSNADFYRIVSEKMVNKGWISPSDAEKLVPDVNLRGPARLMLKNLDSIPAEPDEDSPVFIY